MAAGPFAPCSIESPNFQIVAAIMPTTRQGPSARPMRPRRLCVAGRPFAINSVWVSSSASQATIMAAWMWMTGGGTGNAPARIALDFCPKPTTDSATNRAAMKT